MMLTLDTIADWLRHRPSGIWDDAAKLSGKATPPLDDFVRLTRSVSLYSQLA
ncbi:MAG TPA: hypothetical protein VF450_23760 [Noviherbaspirillum sp.]|jgi:hypothetical protein